MKKIILLLLLMTLFLTSCSNDGYFHDTTVSDTEHSPEENSTADTAQLEPSVAETDVAETHVSETSVSEAKEPDTETSRAEDILANMTVEEKVGQLFLARNPLSYEDGIALIEEKHVGGIIFFGRDFKSSNPESFKSLIDSYNATSKIPLLTAVDEEGGTVCRASLYPAFRESKFKSPAELYAEGGLDAILSDAAEKSDFLLELGLNFNLAPVADIASSKEDFIYERVLGLGREETAEYVSEVVKVMRENGILSALKHFPGYGSNEDTHTGIAYDRRSLDEIKQNDLVPFAAGIEAGVPIVMVSHNIVECIDPNMPSSLSEKVIGMLRNDMDFNGVVITDDLSMDAIKDFTESGEAAVLAILAGADLLCCSNIEEQYSAVLRAVTDGRISEARLDESVLRLIKIKLEYKITE